MKIFNPPSNADYDEDKENNTFGKSTRGHYKPRSDFRFDLKMKCVGKNSLSTGYVISIYPETYHEDSESDSNHL